MGNVNKTHCQMFTLERSSHIEWSTCLLQILKDFLDYKIPKLTNASNCTRADLCCRYFLLFEKDLFSRAENKKCVNSGIINVCLSHYKSHSNSHTQITTCGNTEIV